MNMKKNKERKKIGLSWVLLVVMILLIVLGLLVIPKIFDKKEEEQEPMMLPCPVDCYGSGIYCGLFEINWQKVPFTVSVGDDILLSRGRDKKTGEPEEVVFETSLGCHAVVHEYFDEDYSELDVILELDITNNLMKEEFFNKHKEWYLVDTLNKYYETEGSIEGKITGTMEGTTTGTRGFFFTYPIYDKTRLGIDASLKASLSAITTEKYPLKRVGEEEFKQLVYKYNVRVVKCSEFPYNNFIPEYLGLDVYTVFCAFERENIQFVTELVSITDPIKGCYKNIDVIYNFWTNNVFKGDFVIPYEIRRHECIELLGG